MKKNFRTNKQIVFGIQNENGMKYLNKILKDRFSMKFFNESGMHIAHYTLPMNGQTIFSVSNANERQ